MQVLVSLVILWALFRRAEPHKVMGAFSSGALWPLVVAGALVFLAVFVRALRWYYLLHDAGAREVRLRRAYGLCFIGAALNLLVPGGLGELGKAYYGHRSTGTREEMLGTALIDKLLALVTLCVPGAVAAALCGRPVLCACCAAFAVAFGAPVFCPRLIPWRLANWALATFLRKELNLGKLFRSSKYTKVQYARALAISLVSWLLSMWIVYLVLCAFLPELTFWEVCAVTPFFSLARLIPVAFGGFGTSDSAMVFLLGPPLNPREAVLAGSLTLNVLLVVLPAVVGLVYLWFLPSHRPALSGRSGPRTGPVQAEGAR